MFLRELPALSSTKHFRLQALTFDLARWCLDDGGGVVFTAEVWKRRTAARRTEASGKRPERGADGSGGPRRSGRKGLRTHVRPARPGGGREAGASLCWSHPETAQLSLIRKQKSEKVNYFTADLKLSYRKYRKGFEFVVLFLHLTFLKSWFDVFGVSSRDVLHFSHSSFVHVLLASGQRNPHPGLVAPSTEEEQDC